MCNNPTYLSCFWKTYCTIIGQLFSVVFVRRGLLYYLPYGGSFGMTTSMNPFTILNISLSEPGWNDSPSILYLTGSSCDPHVMVLFSSAKFPCSSRNVGGRSPEKPCKPDVVVTRNNTMTDAIVTTGAHLAISFV